MEGVGRHRSPGVCARGSCYHPAKLMQGSLLTFDEPTKQMIPPEIHEVVREIMINDMRCQMCLEFYLLPSTCLPPDRSE